MRDEARYKREYRRTEVGRANLYLSDLKRKCARSGTTFDLTQEWILSKLSYGRCEQTGIAFVLDSLPKSNRSPWAFSIDKIDPAKGYTKANCQAVVWAYNAAKGQGSDSDVMFLAKCLLGIVPAQDRGTALRMPQTGKHKKRAALADRNLR